MKKSFEVLHNLFSSPCYSKLNYNIEAWQFVPYIVNSIRVGISYVYVKKDKLYIVCKHSQFKFEFKYKKKEIMNGLKLFQENRKMLLQIDDIICYEQKQVNTHVDVLEEFFNEKSEGEFENLASGELYDIFERIRDNILKNLANEGR